MAEVIKVEVVSQFPPSFVLKKKNVIKRTKLLFPGCSVNENEDVFILVSFISIAILSLVIAFSQINLCQTSSMQESPKKISLVERSRPTNFKHHFQRWYNQITLWCKCLTLEKSISYRMKCSFAPFLSVSPFLLLNLARRQCYAYAIGLFIRPEKKS